MRDSKIIIFDEITSALDPKTMNSKIKILKTIKKDKTVIITHKPDLMKIADTLIVLDKWRVIGNGNYKELNQNNLLKSNQKVIIKKA